MNKTIYTIGHSTHAIEEFVDMLKANAVELIVDVRTIPKSSHNPQFNSDMLEKSLRTAGIEYRHLPGLGGLRHAKKDSVNAAWENASFRGFADYMQTEDFERGLTELIEMAGQKRAAIMCAEAVPWRCHRSLIADALLARGIHVMDIISARPAKEHKLTTFAEVRGTAITHPKKHDYN
jgi:uncharacterized protein (DUF488 family)